MKTETFYDILEVSPKASLQEITQAKNKLAKKYHPDANIRHGIDTTDKMQQILEAYKVLSDAEARKDYDKTLLGINPKAKMQTFDLQHPEKDATETTKDSPMIRCWKVSEKLHQVVTESEELFKNHTKTHRLTKLSERASKYTNYLKKHGIPEAYWYPEVMNWLLFNWYKNKNYTIPHLVSMYDAYLKEELKTMDRLKMQTVQFKYQRSVKRLCKY